MLFTRDERKLIRKRGKTDEDIEDFMGLLPYVDNVWNTNQDVIDAMTLLTAVHGDLTQSRMDEILS